MLGSLYVLGGDVGHFLAEGEEIDALLYLINGRGEVGIITKFDIKAKQAELAEFNTELPGTCPVSKLAKPAISINENKNVADAYNMLNDEDVKSLVVTDNSHKVVGMITKNDIAKLEAKEDEAELEADIRKYVTDDDELVKAIINDFDDIDTVALAIIKAGA